MKRQRLKLIFCLNSFSFFFFFFSCTKTTRSNKFLLHCRDDQILLPNMNETITRRVKFNSNTQYSLIFLHFVSTFIQFYDYSHPSKFFITYIKIPDCYSILSMKYFFICFYFFFLSFFFFRIYPRNTRRSIVPKLVFNFTRGNFSLFLYLSRHICSIILSAQFEPSVPNFSFI